METIRTISNNWIVEQPIELLEVTFFKCIRISKCA